MMKRRSFLFVLAATVLVLLSIGAGGFYGFIASGPLSLLQGKPEISPAGAMFVPKQAPVMASLLVNLEELESFVQLVTPPANRGKARAEINQIKESVLANTDLDYRQDIQPWLGDEITFAVTSLDIDRDRGNGSQPGYLVAIATQEPQKSREFLEQFWQSKALAGTELIFEQYKGVKLIYAKAAEQDASGIDTGSGSPLSGTWASAFVGDRFVLFANRAKVLRDAINNVQATNLNLKSDWAYQKALQEVATSRIGVTYVNLPQFLSLVNDKPAIANSEAPNTASSTPEASQLHDSVALALGLNPQGLLAQTAWLSTLQSPESGVESPSLPTLSSPVAALKYLPDSIVLLAAGEDLNKMWTDLSSTGEGNPLITSILSQPLATLHERWGIDLPQDIFSWVQGEYAIGLLPSESNAFDWIFVSEKKATAPAEVAIDQLDAIAQSRGFSIGPLTVGNQKIAAWTKLTTGKASTDGEDRRNLTLKAEVEGVHATVGNYEIFTSSIEAMNRAISAPETGSVLDSNGFKDAIAPLKVPNYGYVYLDWLASREILERQLPLLKLVELAGKPIFDHLGAIALSSPGAGAGDSLASGILNNQSKDSLASHRTGIFIRIAN